ncbi:hypothetical protein A4244_16550 [Bacillus badius]|nr:hypothetical protein A4244_16550 [Bacillus badius]OCS85718.1 hypothetical protein A6M11_16565 [Bacillus badius]OVE51927.1 hypothetical protein B1A98_10285 [Bacillus badius]
MKVAAWAAVSGCRQTQRKLKFVRSLFILLMNGGCCFPLQDASLSAGRAASLLGAQAPAGSRLSRFKPFQVPFVTKLKPAA